MKIDIQTKGLIILLLVILFLPACYNIPGKKTESLPPKTLESTHKPTIPEEFPSTWTPDVTPTLRRWPTNTPEPTNTPKPTPLPTDPVDMVIYELPGEDPPAIKSQLAYASYNGDQLDIYLLTDGKPEPELFIHSPQDDIYPTWSPDGKSLAYLRAGPDPHAFWQEPETDLYLVQNLVQTNLTTNLDLFIPEMAWSSNSNYIAFTGSEKDPPPLKDASLDIYIANVDTKESTRIVNASGVGCRSLSWAPDNWELISSCRGSMVSGLLIDDRSGENAWFTDFIPAEITAWLPSGETIVSHTSMGSLRSIPAEYMRQRDDQTYPESIDWEERLVPLGYQDKAIWAMEWYPRDDNLFMIQSDDLIQVVDLNRNILISILGQFKGPVGDNWEFLPYWDFSGQVTWGPDGEQIAFAFFDGNDAEIGIVNIRTLTFSRITNNMVDDLMPSWKPLP
jgi:WD40 repeat protein